MEQRFGRKVRREAAERVPERSAPPELSYLWGWFAEILEGLAPNGMAPVAISWTEIEAWSRLTGRALHPWEVRLLMRLSRLRAAVLNEQHEKARNAVKG